MNSALVSMRNISKQFPGSVSPALEGVSIDLYPGEIHCLAGENGSGKSTLMHILSGFIDADGGTIEMPENTDIRMIHQAPLVAGDLRVREHLALGTVHETPAVLFGRKIRKEILSLLEEYELFSEIAASIDSYVRDLKPQQKHHLSIASAVISDPDLLIFDEPSTHLTPREKRILFDLMKDLTKRGKSIVLITHKLKELKEMGDKVTALRRGKAVGTFYKDRFLETDIAGILIEFSGKKTPLPVSQGSEEMISVSSVTASSGREQISDISFRVRKGEVMGILGLKGEGLGLLEQVLAGIVPFSAGSVEIKGEPVERITPKLLRERNIGYIPTDRLLMASTAEGSIEDNLILLAYKKLHNKGVFKRQEINALTSSLYAAYHITGNRPGERLGSLSGGNIQRVIMSREISQTPDIIIFAEPYWGLDAAGKALVTSEIQRLQKEGSAVILLSPESEELFGLANRYMVLYEGKPVLQADHSEIDIPMMSRALLGISGGKS